MRNKIWYALGDAKKGEEYLGLYSMRVKSIRKVYKIIIIIIAALGLILWKVWQPVSVIACLLILIGEIATKMEKQIVMTDANVIKLGDLRIKYIDLFNHLDRLWSDFNDECLSDDEIKKIYSEILQEKREIEELDNELYIPRVKKLDRQAENITLHYLNNHYG